MELIYFGLMFCPDSLDFLRKNNGKRMGVAAHIFQTNLLSGIKEIEEIELTVLNIPTVGSYPLNSNLLFMKPYRWEKNNLQVGYINLPIIKRLIQKRRLIMEGESRIRDENDTCIIVYSLYEPFLEAAIELKKRHPGLKILILHTDAVPGRNDMQKYMTPEAIRQGTRVIELAKSFDGFILLTEHIAQTLEIGEKPRLIVDCICNQQQPLSKSTDGSKRICLYTGGLQTEYGVHEMVEAFLQLPEAELWICGAGQEAEYIREKAKQYKNICYFGMVDFEKLQELRDQCDYLINPRVPTGTYTKYSFPSKTAEYMMSGKPVIMYRLEGLSEEYAQYLNYLASDDPDAMAKELRSIFATDYTQLQEKAEKARNFMLNNKTSQIQGERIVAFIKSL